MIDGDEEARLAFVGTLASLDEPQAGEIGVVDVGGGSTEIVVGSAADGVDWSRSFQLGSGRLTDRFIEHDPPLPSELARSARRSTRRCRRPTRSRRPSTASPSPARRPTCAAWSARCSTTSRSSAPSACCRHPVASRSRASSSSSPTRARLLPAGALIMQAAMHRLGTPLWVGRGGIRQGVVLDMVAAARNRDGEGPARPARPRRAVRRGCPAGAARARARARRAGARRAVGRRPSSRCTTCASPPAGCARCSRCSRGAFPKKRHRAAAREVKQPHRAAWATRATSTCRSRSCSAFLERRRRPSGRASSGSSRRCRPSARPPTAGSGPISTSSNGPGSCAAPTGWHLVKAQPRPRRRRAGTVVEERGADPRACGSPSCTASTPTCATRRACASCTTCGSRPSGCATCSRSPATASARSARRPRGWRGRSRT